jgi:hypothetical protein
MLTLQIESMDSLGSRIRSYSMSKPYKCCSMLCEVFFSMFERLWGCALSWWLAISNLKPIWNSGKLLREGHIPMKDSSASPFFMLLLQALKNSHDFRNITSFEKNQLNECLAKKIPWNRVRTVDFFFLLKFFIYLFI